MYTCSVRNLKIISRNETEFTSSNGDLDSGKSIDDVAGLWINDETAHYFPQGLHKIFKNLAAISISFSKLKEVKQSDLCYFPNMTIFHFYENDIEMLEQGLFDYNLKLRDINFSNNKIVKIHPDIFDNMKYLINLSFSSNICIDMYADDSASDVRKVIQQIKSKCSGEPALEDPKSPKPCSNPNLLALNEDVKELDKSNQEISERIKLLTENIKRSDESTLKKLVIIENRCKANDEILSHKIQRHDQEFTYVRDRIEQFDKDAKSSISQISEKIQKIHEECKTDHQKIKEIEEKVQNFTGCSHVLGSIEEPEKNTKSAKNDILINFREKIGVLEMKVSGNALRIEAMDEKLREEHSKYFKELDTKIEQLRIELTNKMDEKVGNLDAKLYKIMKAFNITE